MSVLLGLSAILLSAQELSLIRQPTERPMSRPASGVRLWRASVAALSVANALDVQSSWGKHELNSILAGPSGKFGRDGALIKLGVQGGLLGLEYVITRGHPGGRFYRALSFVNFGAAAVIGGVAAHNYTVPRPSR